MYVRINTVNTPAHRIRNLFLSHVAVNSYRGSVYFRILLSCSIALFYAALVKIYIPRMMAFGCFDDCFNIGAGYLILQGKTLYKDLFFNHQPLGAYMSALIQYTAKPQNILMLIHAHRMFLIWWGGVWAVFLVFRFGTIPVFVLLLYELTKAYVFGERFLMESFVVYPIVYMLFLWCMHKNHISLKEMMFVAFSTWFVVFSRLPYAPLSLTFFVLVCLKTNTRNAVRSAFLLATLSAITLAAVHIPSYIFQVFTVTSQTVGKYEAQSSELFGPGVLRILFSPFVVLTGLPWNHFHILTAILSLMFISVTLIRWKSYKRTVILLWILLALSNIRPVVPGVIYYAAFHFILWYAVLLSGVLLLLFATPIPVKTFVFSSITVGLLTAYAVFGSEFLFENVDRNAEFVTNYAAYGVPGEVLRRLKEPGDDLFIDGADELIYWDGRMTTTYRYGWYTSAMPSIELYRNERNAYLSSYPPQFYIGMCDGTKLLSKEPLDFLGGYTRVYTDNIPSCIFLRDDIAGRYNSESEDTRALRIELRKEPILP